MIPEGNPYNNWKGNGVTTTFDFDFYIENEKQLAVYHTNSDGGQTLLTYGKDYIINEIGNQKGGNIVFPYVYINENGEEECLSEYGVLQEGEILSLCLTLPISQENPFGKSSYLNLETLEYSLDYLTRICQIISRQMERSVKTLEGSEQTAEELMETLNEAQLNAAASASDARNSANTAEQNAKIATQTKEELVEQVAKDKEELDEMKDEIKTDITQAMSDFTQNASKFNYLFVMPIGHIGISPFPIDETKGLQRLLNGQIIIQEQFKEFTKWLKNMLLLYSNAACTEEEWQATVALSTYGQCGKFVVDDEAGTIRLPRITGIIQGLTDFASLGGIIEAGLPTLTTNSTGAHTHTRGTMNITGSATGRGTDNSFIGTDATVSGAFVKGATIAGVFSVSSGGDGVKFQLDASKGWTGATSSNGAHTHTIAGTTDTVQPETICYPYYIQVATGMEETIDMTREIEFNNPFSLFEVKWSASLLNNASWLISDGQLNPSTIYVDAYDDLLKAYSASTDESETVGGITITFRRDNKTGRKITTDKVAYNDILNATGTAWYFVLVLEEQGFILPQTNGFLQGGGSGEFVEAGLPSISHTHTRGTMDIKGEYYGIYDNQPLGAESGAHYSGAFYKARNAGSRYASSTADGVGGSLGFQASKNWTGATSSNSAVPAIYGKNTTVQPNAVKGHLYFYVGVALNNANLINVGRIEENLAKKVDSSAIWYEASTSTLYIGV